MKISLIFLILFTVLLSFDSYNSNNSNIYAQTPQPQIEVIFPNKPIPFKSENKTQIAYEMHITNFGSNDLLFNSLEITDEKKLRVDHFEDEKLFSLLKTIGANNDPANKSLLQSGRRIVVFIWLTFENKSFTPKFLKHKLVFESTRNGNSKTKYVLNELGLEIRTAKLPTISSPIKGKKWVVANGASNFSNHRRTIITLDGKPRISQRFAIDFAKLGDDGKLAKDDPQNNKSYYGYGEEVIAVSNAKVVSIQDEIPENVPLKAPAVPINLRTISGNYVILDIGHGYFAFYAHLQSGSIKVRVGDTVKKGETLALLGNSGNSDLPHLHFHICDANSPLASEGIPFHFNFFENLGFIESADALAEGKTWKPQENYDAVKYNFESPSNNMVVNFE
jgi:murein DD-endopeptidase MepM/ murein hydrolase activator NlpD